MPPIERLPNARVTAESAHLEPLVAASYISKRLRESERALVEEHLAICDECRAEIRSVHAVIAGQSRRRWPMAAAIAAAILLIVVVPPLTRRGETDDLRSLGRVADAPAYFGIAVRSASASRANGFAAGMRAYSEQRYADAISQLEAARATPADEPAASFFLGASHMMLGEASAANESFKRVIQSGPSRYLGEAHYYRGKVLLQLGRPDDALAELAVAAATAQTPMREVASALRDSIRLRAAR